jgi:predicted methyltransferase
MNNFLFGLAALAAAPMPVFAATPDLDRAVHAPWRSPDMIKRDAARHPGEELKFFGIKPRSNVVEIWPWAGYWTEILAPYLLDTGTYTLAMGVPDKADHANGFAMTPSFRALLDAHPEIYGKAKLTMFGPHDPDLAPPGSADFVLTFRNLHNWMGSDDAPEMLAAIRRALKPGGVLGIEDHRANTKTPQDPKARSGYVRQDYAIALVEKAGFKLVGSSEINANPRDTADYARGVWTLPPSYAFGAVDHDKYAAIGEADNFVLKFVKR